MLKQLVMLIFCSCLFFSVFTQTKSKAHFLGLEDGLPHSLVNEIVQDKQGYLWFGTANGLMKYNGYDAEIYKPETTNNLLNDFINALCVSDTGRIFIGHKLGITVYDHVKEKFYDINDILNKQKLFEGVEVIAKNKEGLLYFLNAKDNCIYSYNEKKETLNKIAFSDSLGFDASRCNVMYVTPQRDIWIGTFHGLFVYHANEKKMERFECFNTRIDGIAGHDNRVWFSMDGKLYETVYANGSFAKPNLLPDIKEVSGVDKLYYDNESNKLFIATQEMVYSYNIHDNVIMNEFQLNENINAKINALYVDFSGTIWLSPFKSGVYYKFLKEKDFKTIQSVPQDRNSLSGNNVYSIFEDEDKLWIGTWDKVLNCYLPSENKFLHFKEYKINNKQYTLGAVVDIQKSDKGELWLGMAGGNATIVVYNNKNNTWRHIYPDDSNPNTISGWSARSIVKDSDGDIWVGTIDGGLNVYDSDKGLFISRKNNDSLKKHIQKGVWSFYEDNNLMWVGTVDALYSIDKSSWQINKFIIEDSSNEIRSINRDQKHTLWVGTSYGLFKQDTGKKFVNHSKKYDISIETVYGILVDDSNNLWLSGEQGLIKHDPASKRTVTFGTADGLSSREFNFGAYHKGPNGTMYFGSVNGVTFFHPEDIQINNIQPKVMITDFFINNQEILPGKEVNGRVILQKSISYTDKIILKHKEKVISFEYIALNYQNAEDNKYAYKLEGFNKDGKDEWINVGSEKRYVSYTNLSPGTYNLKVKAANNDNVWNEEGTSLKIVVLPPWWQTWWFRGLVVVAIALAVGSFFRFRIKRLKRRQAELEELVNQRTREVEQQKQELSVQAENLKEVNKLLTDRNMEIELQAEELMKVNKTKDKLFSIIAHDLRNPFQGIINFSGLLIKKFRKIKEDQKLKFIELINSSSKSAHALLENLLEWSKTQAGTVAYNPTSFSVLTIVKETVEIMNVNARRKNIEINIDVDKSTKVFADKNMITTVLRNLVNNAIKFTVETGNIDIAAEQGDKETIITVKDSGIGIPPDKIDKLFDVDAEYTTKGTSGEEGSGLGLVICKEFVIKNKGIISVSSKPGRGTIFIIQLPAHETAVVDTAGEDKEYFAPHDDKQKRKSNNQKKHLKVDKLETSKKDEEKPLILLVDDNESIRLQVSNYLDNDYTFKEAQNGMVAMEIAKNIIPDLVVCDIMMPEMDGIEFCDKLKNHELTSHIPVIILTAKITKKSEIEGLKTGADDYITKPFNPELLKVRIDNLLDSRKKLKEKFAKIINLEPASIQLNSHDDHLFNRMITIVEENMSDDRFGVNEFSKIIGISRTQLFRKMKGLTGETPSEFLKNYRMKRAAQLIKSESMNISEVMYAVGFESTSYFAKCFKEAFGVLPSDYL